MPSDDPISSATSGATEGALNWSLEQIKSLAQKFLNRNLAFIEDSETITLVKEQRKSAEWEVYNKHVKDSDLRLLIQMGLSLRRLEKNQQGLQRLRDRIVARYGRKGLHIAEFVQNKALTAFIGIAASKARNAGELTETIESILNDIDKYVAFIKNTDNVASKVEELRILVIANKPVALILLGSKSAQDLTRTIALELNRALKGYEMIKHEESNKIMFVFAAEEDYATLFD